MILPVNTQFKIQGITVLDKTTLPNLSVLLCCMSVARARLFSAFKDVTFVLLSILFMVSPFFTAHLNPDEFSYGGLIVPAMSMYDGASQLVINLITLIPFVAGYGLINTDRRRAEFVAALVLAGLAYSLPMLLEVRLSPQLHRWVYGFFPHSFGQQVRDGGFRPVVFLGHGLLVAIFAAMVAIAAVARWREAARRHKMRAGLVAIYCGALVVACKSAGALVLAAVLAPAMAFLRAKRIALIAAVISTAILIYPALRANNLIPVDSISAISRSFNPDRANSLDARLENESVLLQKAELRPIFGWGSWGRSRIYSSNDGRDVSVTDGEWIITLGAWGWCGYIAMFGLLCAGNVKLLWHKRVVASISISSAALCILLAMNMFDCIPNASDRPLTWMMAGSVLALTRREKRQPAPAVRSDFRSG